MIPWESVEADPQYQSLDPVSKGHVKAQWFKDNIAFTQEFQSLSEKEKINTLNNWANSPSSTRRLPIGPPDAIANGYEQRRLQAIEDFELNAPADFFGLSYDEQDKLKEDYVQKTIGREPKEEAFQQWYAGHAKRLGLSPDPDDPEHFYDYRAAYEAGADPGPDGHWPSKFKLPGHPNRFVKGIDTITGKPMDEVQHREVWERDQYYRGDEPLTFFRTALGPEGVRVGQSWETGHAQVELGLLRARQVAGEDTPEIRQKIAEIKRSMPEPYRGDRGIVEYAASSIAEMLPIMIKGTTEGAKMGAMTGMTFASAAGLAGQAGPQVAVPEEIVTVPLSFGSGYMVGQVSGSLMNIAQIEAGLAYDELLDLTDENGNKVDPTIARAIAGGVGVVNGLIEASQIGTLAKTIPGVKQAIAKATRAGVVKALRDKTIKNLALKSVGRYGAVVASETGQELLQETTNILGDYVAAELSQMDDLPQLQMDQIIQRYKDTAKQSAAAFAVMAFPGSATSAVTDARSMLLDHGEENETPESLLGSKPQPEEAAQEPPAPGRQPLNPATEPIDAEESAAEFSDEELAAAENRPNAPEIKTVQDIDRENEENLRQPQIIRIPERIAKLSNDELVKRKANIQKAIDERRATDKQKENIELINQELTRRGIKPADESGQAFSQAATDQAMQSAQDAEAAGQEAWRGAIEGLTQDKANKSAEQSAQDMAVEQELLNNRIQRERIPQARKVAAENPGMRDMLADLHNAPGPETAEQAVRQSKVEDIEKAMGTTITDATAEDLLRAEAVFKHDGRKDMLNLVSEIREGMKARAAAVKASADKMSKANAGGAKTLGGFLKSIGGINPAGLKSDILDQRKDASKAGLLKNDGLEIEKAKEVAVREGWMLPSEDLMEILSQDPEQLRRGRLDEEPATKFQKEKAYEEKASVAAPSEMPPDYEKEGAYKQIPAGDLEEGTRVGLVIDGAYDDYEVVSADIFGDGITVRSRDKELTFKPTDRLEVRASGIKEVQGDQGDQSGPVSSSVGEGQAAVEEGIDQGAGEGEAGTGRYVQTHAPESDQVENAAKAYDYSSTQVDIDGPAADDLKKWAHDNIPDSELAGDGREDRPHITVKYGLHTEDPGIIEQIVKEHGPIKVILGKVSVFKNDDADIVKVSVRSKDLRELNKKIAASTEHTDTFKIYDPHVTLAYVKKGEGEKYAKAADATFTGKELTFDSLTFSGKDGKLTAIPLSGSKTAENEKQAGLPLTDEPKIEIPDLKDSKQAVEFGEQATPEQVKELERLEKEARGKEVEYKAAKDFSDARTENAFKAQLYREALEASRGEHPSQREKNRPTRKPIAPKKAQDTPAAKNVAQLLYAFGLENQIFDGEDFHRVFVNKPYIDLVIERHLWHTGDRDAVFFTHYLSQNGDTFIDSEMIFTIDPAGRLHLVETATQNTIRGGELRGRDQKYANMFAKNLIDQGWEKATEKKDDIEEKANEAATSDQNDTPEPTDDQKKAGNYKKGHVTVQGLDITIENPAGSTRSGTDGNGKAWSVTMKHHYGYFKRSEGKDGDQIDVIIGPSVESPRAFIVDQVDPKTRRFDEHKVVMGARDIEAAKAIYLDNYEPGWDGLGDITEVSIPDLKDWISAGKQSKPYANKLTPSSTRAEFIAAIKSKLQAMDADGVTYRLWRESTGYSVKVIGTDGKLIFKKQEPGGHGNHWTIDQAAQAAADHARFDEQAAPKFEIGDRVRPRPGSGISDKNAGVVQHIRRHNDGSEWIKTDKTGNMHFAASDWELDTSEPAADGPAKEPWQMTREQYLEHRQAKTKDEISIAQIGHVKQVKDAVAAGKDVPIEVLHQYRHNVWAQKAIEAKEGIKKPGVHPNQLSVADLRKLTSPIKGILKDHGVHLYDTVAEAKAALEAVGLRGAVETFPNYLLRLRKYQKEQAAIEAEDGTGEISEKFPEDTANPTGFSSKNPAEISEKFPEISQKQAPGLALADKVYLKLAKKQAFTWRDLFAMADEAFGGTQAQGAYTPKDAYDAMELGVNQLLADQLAIIMDGTAEQAQKTVLDLKKLTNLLPAQTKRTEEQEKFQQFSTPPGLSFVSNWVANIGEDDVYLEPSAGIGGLAVFGKLAGAKKVYVNELSDRRAALLEALGFDKVFHENAEQLDNILPGDIKPTVIVMNPPFSATAGRVENNKTKYGAQHVEQALARLEPGGRLVAIVGRGMADDRPTFRDWWKRIKAEYNVLANVSISGDDYGKYGTHFDNQILVIDKTGPTDNTLVTGFAKHFEDLPLRLQEIRNARQPANVQTDQRPAGVRAGSVNDQGAGHLSQPTRNPRPSTPSDNAGTRQPRPASPPSRGSGASPAEPDRSGHLRSEEGGRASGLGKPADLGPDSGTAGPDQRPSDRKPNLEVKSEGPKKKDQISDSIFESYHPAVSVAGAQPHPTPLVESAAMSDTQPPKAVYVPDLPKHVVEGGPGGTGLSAIQLEAVVYAGQSHQRILKDGRRRGFFIGDGTGVGKGREISGIIHDNWRQGRKKAVWVSENWDLLKAAVGDLKDSGWKEGAQHLFSHKPIKSGGQITERDQGILFTTYTTLRTGFKNYRDDEAKTHADMTIRMNQIVDWLGPDFDGVIAFDESHNMANAAPQRGARGVKPAADQALSGIALQRRLPKARVVYVSATGATEVENLVYADRLGLWGEGTTFADAKSFVNSISSGGIATMELVARNLKSLGLYLARSLSYADVTYDRLVHKLDSDQQAKYNELARAWQVVLHNIDRAIEVTGGDKSGANLSAFWGAHQRFFNHIITTFQMPSAVESMKNDIENGRAVVIQLVDTDDEQQKRALGRREQGQELEDLDMTPRENLMSYLEHSFPVQQFEEYTDENGTVRRRPVFDSNGEPVLNRQAVRLRDEMLERVGAIVMPSGPLEYLVHNLGHENMAEVTGRGRRIIINPKTGKMELEKRSDKIIAAEVDDFINDKRQILVFSGKGATGRSYHADRRYKNQRPRVHYLVQPGWRADKAVQGLGRTHRSNQVSAPKFIMVTTDLKGQARFISSIARRLDQLGALTKGERKTGSQGIFQARDNLESEYASEALNRLINGIAFKQDPMAVDEFERQTGLKLTGKKGLIVPPITKFLNRLLSMEIEQQNTIFQKFTDHLDEVVQEYADRGALDVGVETISGASVKKASEQIVFRDDDTGAETKYVQIDVTNPTDFLDYGKATEFFIDPSGFWQNVRSGKVYIAGQNRSLTDSTGKSRIVRSLINPMKNRQVKDLDEIEDTSKWRKLTKTEAKKLWTAEYEKLPATITKRHHLLTGNILPIWDRIEGRTTVYRMQDDDGNRYIGRVIPAEDLQRTMDALDIAAGRVEIPASDIYNQVMFSNARVRLEAGWALFGAKVSGEDRIELRGPTYGDLDWVRQNGIIIEKIQYVTRYFVPTNGQAEGIIKKIINRKAVVSVDVYAGPRLDGSRFSRRKVQIGGPRMAAADLRKTVLSKIKGWENAPTVHVLQSQDELPVSVFDDLASQQGEYDPDVDIIDGVYHQGAVYLVADNLTEETAISTLLHESFGHLGLRGVMGDAIVDTLRGIYQANSDEIAQVARDYGLDLADEINQLQATEEWLARLSVKQPHSTWIGRVVAAIREWLRKWIPNLHYTDTEIRELLARARRFVQGRAGRRRAPAFDQASAYERAKMAEKWHSQMVNEGMPLFQRRKKNTKRIDHTAILSGEVKKRMDDARGAPEEKLIDKLKETAADLNRERSHFPGLQKIKDKGLRARLHNILRLHQEIPETAKAEAIQMISGWTRGLSKDGFEVYRMNIILADMARDIDKGLLIDGNLPFGFRTTAEVMAARDAYKQLANDNDEVRQALAERAQAVNGLRDRLVDAKLLNREVQEYDDYFHHQVLQYWATKYGLGTSSKDVRTHWRPWMAKRKGSALDYNTDYVEAEFMAVSQQLVQLKTKETLQRAKDEADLYVSLKQTAKQANLQKLYELFPPPMEDPLLPYKRQIAWATKTLGKMAAEQKLQYDSAWQDIVDDMAAEYEMGVEGIEPVVGFEDPRFFHFLSYLVRTGAPGSSFAATIFKAIRARDKFIQDTLGNSFVTWQKLVPEGYTVWKPDPGKGWFWANTVADNIIQRVIAGEINLEDRHVRQVLAKGRELIWVIPDGLAETLDNFREPIEPRRIGRAADYMLSAWKQFVLLNPYSVIKYNVNNFSGDLDIVMAYKPAIAKHAAKATRDLWRWARNKEVGQSIQKELEEARRLGVIGSGWSVQEVKDVIGILGMDGFVKHAILQEAPNRLSPKKWLENYWNFVRQSTAWRENILRLAAYRYFVANQNKRLYGASNPIEINSLEGNEKAAKLARELLGDYGDLSKTGEYIRRRLIPFYSWLEINAPRYAYMMRNLKYEDAPGATGTRLAAVGSKKLVAKGLGLALRANILFAAVMLWNMTFFPDEEEEMGESGRRQLHIILGRNSDGSILSIRFQGALSDALSFFGLEDWPSDIKDVTSGKMTVGEKLVAASKDAGLALLNKGAQAIRPEVKLFAELASGYSLYPDVARPIPIRDRVEHALRTFKLDSVYRGVTGRPERGMNGKTGIAARAMQHLANDIESMLAYDTDPGIQAYYDTRSMVFDWKAKQGDEKRYGGRPTNKSNALYWYKQAMKFGDLDAANRYLKKYYELGGTAKGRRQSVKMAHPLSGIQAENRYAFRQSLSPAEEERLQMAVAWYKKTYFGKELDKSNE